MKVGNYDHLNETCPVKLELPGVQIEIKDMKSLVEAIDKSNYGTYRLISELIRQNQYSEWCERREFAKVLIKWLESGGY
jgi:hypothetical protein